MTIEREEFEKLFCSGRSVEELESTRQLWSWHQQSLDRAVEKERKKTRRELMKWARQAEVYPCVDAIEFIEEKLPIKHQNPLTPPQLDKLSIKK